MITSKIPFLDLVTVHRELREELRAVFGAALDTAGFIGGPAVQQFERDFAEFCDTRFALAWPVVRTPCDSRSSRLVSDPGTPW